MVGWSSRLRVPFRKLNVDEETLLNKSMVELAGQKLQDLPCALRRKVNETVLAVDESFVAAAIALVEMIVALSRIRFAPLGMEQFCN